MQKFNTMIFILLSLFTHLAYCATSPESTSLGAQGDNFHPSRRTATLAKLKNCTSEEKSATIKGMSANGFLCHADARLKLKTIPKSIGTDDIEDLCKDAPAYIQRIAYICDIAQHLQDDLRCPDRLHDALRAEFMLLTKEYDEFTAHHALAQYPYIKFIMPILYPRAGTRTFPPKNMPPKTEDQVDTFVHRSSLFEIHAAMGLLMKKASPDKIAKNKIKMSDFLPITKENLAKHDGYLVLAHAVFDIDTESASTDYILFSVQQILPALSTLSSSPDSAQYLFLKAVSNLLAQGNTLSQPLPKERAHFSLALIPITKKSKYVMCRGSATRLTEINGLFKSFAISASETGHKELNEIIYAESKHLLIAAKPAFVHRVLSSFRNGRPIDACDVTELANAQEKGSESALAIAPPDYKDLLVIYDAHMFGASRYFLDACHDPQAYATALTSSRTKGTKEPEKFVEPRLSHLLVKNAEFRIKYHAFGKKISIDYLYAHIFQDPPTYKLTATGVSLSNIEKECFAALRTKREQYIKSSATAKLKV